MRRTTDDRGQAYTLEGFIGAIIVLMAVLFALQAVVITPTTGGAVDRSSQVQTQQEVQDALVVAENEGDLSELVRNWETTDDPDEEESFYNESVGDDPGSHAAYTTGGLANETTILGGVLQERFEDRGQNYNVELVYKNEDEDGYETWPMVYQGSPSSTAVSASYTVTLYDDQELTAPQPNGEDITLDEADGGSDYPIGNNDAENSVYNVVEVRVVVW